MHPPTQRGKLVVATMFFVAVLLGGFAWWFNFRSNPQCRDFWGSDSIVLIQSSPRVEFLRLEPVVGIAGAGPSDPAGSANTAAGPRIEANGLPVPIEEIVNISDTSGQLVNARHALIVDTSFRWQSPMPQEPPQWDFGLRFVDDSHQVTVLFDVDQQRMEWVEARRGLLLVPAIAAAFRKKQLDWSRFGSMHEWQR